MGETDFDVSDTDRATRLATAYLSGDADIHDLLEFAVAEADRKVGNDGVTVSLAGQRVDRRIEVRIPDRPYPTVIVDSAQAEFYINFDGDDTAAVVDAVESVAARAHAKASTHEERYRDRRAREAARKAPQAA